MPAIEIGVSNQSKEIREQAVKRAAAKPVHAKAKAERRAKGAGGDVHAVVRSRGRSRKQEASAAHKVDRGVVKRWRRAHSLPSFPDPPGYTYCWISSHRRRHGDEAGILAAKQEGWEFVRAEELDEDSLPTQTHSRYGEMIGNDSTVLMKLPDELKAQRDGHFNQKRDLATRQVTRRKPGLAEATRQMPLVEDRNDVFFDKPLMRARRVPAADKTDD